MIADRLDLVDPLELIVVEPGAHLRIEIGEQRDRLGGEEGGFVARRDVDQAVVAPP